MLKNRRALSAVIGGVFMLIMMSTSITYTAVSMNQVAELAEEVSEKQVLDYEQTTEEFEIVKVSIDNNQFNMTVKNTGDIPVHLTRFWVENTTSDSTWLPGKYEMDIDIGSGQTVKNIGQNIGLTALDTESYQMDLISKRGNSEKVFLNAVGEESNYVKLRAIPSTVAPGFSTTLILEVVNTGTTQLLNLQPEITLITPTGTGNAIQVGLVPEPELIESLKPGNSAFFEYIYTIEGADGDTVSFTGSLVNGLETDIAVVTVTDVESAENANVALQAEGLGPSAPIDEKILIFHQEQINTPGDAYQMYSGSPEGGENGERIELDKDDPTFITMNGTLTSYLIASNWVASLAVQSNEVPPSLNDEEVDMIFHFEDGQDAHPIVNSEGDSSRDLNGCAGAGCSGWYPNGIEVNPDWTERKQVVIQGSRVVGGPHTDFPVLVKIDADAALSAGALANGDDIVFTTADGLTKLDHEIEYYNEGTLVAWVEVPSISQGTDVAICMYYNNNEDGLANQENIIGTWSDNYEAVYHLHDDFLDSTSNSYDGTNVGSDDIAALIGDGQHFEANDDTDRIDVGDWSVSGSAISMSAWVKWESIPNTDPRIISKANGGGENDHVFMLGEDGKKVRERIKTGTNDGSGTETLKGSNDNMGTGTWYLMSATYDGNQMRVFLNGIQEGSDGKSGSLRVNSWDVWIGNNPVDNRAFDGVLDEVRISSEARSANWFQTEYNNVGLGEARPFLVISSGASSGNPTWVADSGPHGSGSYLFDGVNDCMISSNPVSDEDDNNISDEVDTTALWFKTNLSANELQPSGYGVTEEQHLVYWGTDADEYYKISLDDTGKVLFEFDTSEGDATTTCLTVNDYDDNVWYHVTAVRGVNQNDDKNNDDCVLHIHDIDGVVLEKIHTSAGFSSNDVDVDDTRWTVGTSPVTDGNFFNGYIDDIMHWNGDNGDDYLDTEEAEDLAKTNYGDAAHRINFDLTIVDKEGNYVSTIVNDASTDIPFQDPRDTGNKDNDDLLYSYYNHTMSISPQTIDIGQRVNFTMSWVPATTTWEPLDLDMKIDDTGFINPFPSYIQMSKPPTVAFPSYYIYDNDLELDVFISNIGTDGIFYISQGTRAVFNGTLGTYAGLIHSINGTDNDDDVEDKQDSIFFAQGELAEMYFYKPTDHPSTGELGNLIPAGNYETTIWAEGYTDQGESFERTITLGTVTVIDD